MGGIVFYLWTCIYKQQAYLEKISSDLFGKFIPPKSFWQQISHARGSYRFEGQCSQRAMTIQYFYRWKKVWNLQPAAAPDERLEIQFPVIQKFWLRMILDPNHEQRAGEVALGNPVLDSLYVVHSNQPDAAREFLTSQAALHDLQRLPFPFNRLEIHRGKGKAEFYFPARRNFGRMHLQIAVESFSRLFSEYENSSKLVILVSVSSDAHCPYCREFLSSAGTTVQCIQCNARVHKSCWDENKQCTTWGCESSLCTESS